MSNDDTNNVPNENPADDSQKYDKILEGFARDKREIIMLNIAVIKRSQRKEAMTAIEAGKALSEIKKQCGADKAKFREICAATQVTRRTLQHEMRVAKRFYDVRDLVCDIPLNVLIKLAKKATPKPLVEWVIQEKQAGRSIDLIELKGKLDATCKKMSPSLTAHEPSPQKDIEVAVASTNEAGACSPLSQTDPISGEAADAGATMSDGTAGPTVADENVGGTTGVVKGDGSQPVEGRVLRLEERIPVGTGEDGSVTAAHNAANMLMSNDPVDPHELATQLEAADADELKKLLIERCNTAEAA